MMEFRYKEHLRPWDMSYCGDCNFCRTFLECCEKKKLFIWKGAILWAEKNKAKLDKVCENEEVERHEMSRERRPGK